jgi:hypothetical protein
MGAHESTSHQWEHTRAPRTNGSTREHLAPMGAHGSTSHQWEHTRAPRTNGSTREHLAPMEVSHQLIRMLRREIVALSSTSDFLWRNVFTCRVSHGFSVYNCSFVSWRAGPYLRETCVCEMWTCKSRLAPRLTSGMYSKLTSILCNALSTFNLDHCRYTTVNCLPLNKLFQ